MIEDCPKWMFIFILDLRSSILDPLSSILDPLSSTLDPQSSTLYPHPQFWSPRRDLNSHKTLTAGIALPLSYAGPKQLRISNWEFRISPGFQTIRNSRFAIRNSQVETMGFEPIHRVCRTRMPPTTSSPHTELRISNCEFRT
jgi:hypothetical protein